MTEHPSEKDAGTPGRLRALARDLSVLRDRIRMGGGEERVRRQHDQGKLTARERIDLLLDPGAPWV
ncbi:MAG: hypothetical protein ACWGSQ_04405, partial [Longimicrobiales bacterium]